MAMLNNQMVTSKNELRFLGHLRFRVCKSVVGIAFAEPSGHGVASA